METPTPPEHVADWLRKRFVTKRAGTDRIDFAAASQILNVSQSWLRQVCNGERPLYSEGFASWKQRADSPTPNQRTR